MPTRTYTLTDAEKGLGRGDFAAGPAPNFQLAGATD
jgi:hypothetical protein